MKLQAKRFLSSWVLLRKGYGGLYKAQQRRKKEESEKLRGERYQIKSIDLRFGRWQVVGLRKARRQDVPIACFWDEL